MSSFLYVLVITIVIYVIVLLLTLSLKTRVFGLLKEMWHDPFNEYCRIVRLETFAVRQPGYDFFESLLIGQFEHFMKLPWEGFRFNRGYNGRHDDVDVDVDDGRNVNFVLVRIRILSCVACFLD